MITAILYLDAIDKVSVFRDDVSLLSAGKLPSFDIDYKL